MPQLLKNNVSGVLANELSAVGTSMTLVDATAFPDPGADYYLCTLAGLDSNGREDKWEIVKVTAKASNTLTITRAQESTTNRLWPVGTAVQMRLTAGAVATMDAVTSHTSNTSNPHGVTKAQVGLGNVDNTSDANKPVSTAVQTALNNKSDSGHTHIAATTSAAGFLSAADKTKLDGIATNATNYTHPANHPASIITQDASNRFVTDAEKAAWNSKAAGTHSHAISDVTSLQTALDGKQPLDADLTAIAALAGASGLLKKTAANTWELDTTAYTTNAGTVTSVGVTVPAGLSVTGSPVTSSGTIAIALASGYSIPTTSKQTNWDAAYGWGNHASAGYSTLALGSIAGAALAASGSAGSATTAAKSDHVHPFPTAANVGAEPSISKSIGFAKWNGSAWTFDNSVYLTSFTESDPTVPSHVKGITTTNVNNWNTAYGWGNHASAGYSTLALGTAAGSPLAASGAAGSATTAAKSDHVHPFPTAANVGAVAASGGAASGLTLNDGYTEEVFTVTGTAPALSPTNGSIQTWTLTGNATPTAGTWASGQSMTLMVDDGSAYTIDWAPMSITWKTSGGTAPTLLTTGYTAVELTKVGTTIYGWLAGDA